MTGLSNVEKVDVVGVGLNATDTLIPVAHYPARGTKVAIRPTTVLPGGQTATAVVACQQWDSARAMSAKSAETPQQHFTPRNFRASALKRISSPLPTVPASKPSSSWTIPASAQCFGGAIVASPCAPKNSSANGSSTRARFTSTATTLPPPRRPPLGRDRRAFLSSPTSMNLDRKSAV